MWVRVRGGGWKKEKDCPLGVKTLIKHSGGTIKAASVESRKADAHGRATRTRAGSRAGVIYGGRRCERINLLSVSHLPDFSGMHFVLEQ